jgi:hypothetical protein
VNGKWIRALRPQCLFCAQTGLSDAGAEEDDGDAALIEVVAVVLRRGDSERLSQEPDRRAVPLSSENKEA